MRYPMSGYANLIGKIQIKQIFISVTPTEVVLKLSDRLLRQRVRTQLRNQALNEKNSKVDRQIVENYTDDQIRVKFHRLLAERVLLREQDEFDIEYDSDHVPSAAWKDPVDEKIAGDGLEYVAAQNSPVWIRSITEDGPDGYEYTFHHDQSPEEGRDRSDTDYTAFPTGALKIAITKSPENDRISRENPRYVESGTGGYNAIRELILIWNQAGRDSADEKSDQADTAAPDTSAADAFDRRRDLVNSKKADAEQLGKDMADSFLHNTLTQTKQPETGSRAKADVIGWVWKSADGNWVGTTLRSTWSAAEDLFPTLDAGTHGDLVLDSKSPGGGRYMWNAFTARVSHKMGLSPYKDSWGFGYTYKQVVEWSYNNITDWMMEIGDYSVSQVAENWRDSEAAALKIKRSITSFMAWTGPGKSSWTDFGKFGESSMAQPWD